MKKIKLALPIVCIILLLIYLLPIHTERTGSFPAPIYPSRELIINLKKEPEGLDPAFWGRAFGYGQEAGHIINNTFEGLTREINGTIMPGMAAKWTITQDFLEYTFELNDSNWSDGLPVTARDFEYAWKRLLSPELGSSYASHLYCIKGAIDYNKGIGKAEDVGIMALDAKTFRVTLEKPDFHFLALTSYQFLMPVRKEIVEEDQLGWSTHNKTSVSNGPFFMASYAPGYQVTLEKNPHYWNAEKVYLDKIIVTFDSEKIDAVDEYNKYKLDMIDSVVDSNIVKAVPPNGKTTPGPTTNYYIFNTTKFPFDNIAIRKALLLAVDRNAIFNKAALTSQIPAYGLVPPHFTSINIADLNTKPFREKAGKYDLDNYKFNIDQAKLLLSDAGYPNGEGFPPIEITYDINVDSNIDGAIAKAVKELWEANLGIKVILKPQANAKSLQKAINNNNYMVASSHWTAEYSDPMAFLEQWSSDNQTITLKWRSPIYDGILEKIRNSWLYEREDFMVKAERKLIDEAMLIPLYHSTETILIRDYVKGYSKNLMGYFWYGDTYIDDFFKDVDTNHFAYYDIRKLYELDIIEKKHDYLFYPDSKAVAEDINAWLSRSLRKRNIDKLMKDYNYDQTLTREEAASVLVRAFRLKPVNYNVNLPKDIDKISLQYRKDVITLYQHNISISNKEESFLPHEQITKAEFASLLSKLIK